MRGLNSDDIMAVLDFIYCGEANVYQENIDAFFALAEDLKLKGLGGNETGSCSIKRNVEGRPQEETKPCVKEVYQLPKKLNLKLTNICPNAHQASRALP